MKKLDLDELKRGLPGISRNIGAFLVEAAVVCLEKNGHRPGVKITVTGLKKEEFQLEWTDFISLELAKSWNDLREATEYGATALGALMILSITGLLVTGRVPQEEQADYVLQTPENYSAGLIEPDALLEISGILKETSGNTLNMRIQKKKKQILEGAIRNYPTYIAFIEFSGPNSKIIKV